MDNLKMEKPHSDNQNIEAGGADQHTTTTTSVADSGITLPRLHFSFNWIYLFGYIVFLLILNLLVPCLIFYLLRNGTLVANLRLMTSLPLLTEPMCSHWDNNQRTPRSFVRFAWSILVL